MKFWNPNKRIYEQNFLFILFVRYDYLQEREIVEKLDADLNKFLSSYGLALFSC